MIHFKLDFLLNISGLLGNPKIQKSFEYVIKKNILKVQ